MGTVGGAGSTVLSLTGAAANPDPFRRVGAPEPTPRGAVGPMTGPGWTFPPAASPRTGWSLNLRQARSGSAEGREPGTSPRGSGWSHQTGTRGRPSHGPAAIPGSACTSGPRHRAGPPLARRRAGVCAYLGLGFPPRPRVVQATFALPPRLLPAGPLLPPRVTPPLGGVPTGHAHPEPGAPEARPAPARAGPGSQRRAGFRRAAAGGAERPGGRRPPAEPGPGLLTRRLQSSGGGGKHGGPRGFGGPSGRDGQAAAPGARGARDVTRRDSEPGPPGRAGRGSARWARTRGGRAAGTRACGARRGRPGGARGGGGQGPPPRAPGRRRLCCRWPCCWRCCWAARTRSTRATCAAGRGGESARRDPGGVRAAPRGQSARGSETALRAERRPLRLRPRC